jgi:hypothetical protein
MRHLRITKHPRLTRRTSGLLVAVATTVALSAAASAPAWAVTYGEVASFGSEELSNPVGVAVNQESGDVYVANLSFSPAREFGPSGKPLGSFDEGFLSGTAVDPVNGNVYVVNGEAETVETYTATGEGPIASFSVEGSANLFEFLTVVQIASDQTGNVYFPNAPHNEIQEFNPSGALLQTITGSGASALKEPTGVAVDAAGDVYVADRGDGRVEEFGPSGAFVLALGTGVDQTTGGNVCTAASGDTCGPGGDGSEAVAVNAQGDVFAGDQGGAGFHVVVYDPAGAELADFGSGVIGTSEVEAINTLTVGPGGLVYVADGGHNVVWVYAPQSEPTLLEVSSFAVNQTGATLKAKIDPGNLDTTYRFEYGFCPASAPCTGSPYTTSAPVPDGDIGNGSSPVVVAQELTGLHPGTTYHYRVVAVNADGETVGAEQAFETPPLQPPVVATGQAQNVAQNSVTLAGTVETEGFQTEYEFDIGTDTGYGTRIFGNAGAEPGAQTFTVPLQGLAPGTTYHYRLAATNTFGTTYGADQTFTTPIYPTATLTAPTSPPLIGAILLVPKPSAGSGAGKAAGARRAAHSARRNGAQAGHERSHKRTRRRPSRTARTHRADRRSR